MSETKNHAVAAVAKLVLMIFYIYMIYISIVQYKFYLASIVFGLQAFGCILGILGEMIQAE